MTATLKVLVPEETTNYVQNPGFRYDTTGWTAIGSAITRVLTYALYGISSLMVATSGAVLAEGVYYRISSLAGISDGITASVYVRGQGIVRLRLWESGGKEWYSQPLNLLSDQWTRLVVSGFTTGSNDLRLYVETDKNIQASTFYIANAQLERKPYPTTYADGDQPGCRWNIINSASNTTRDGNTRFGGRWVTLAKPCKNNNDIYLTVLGGLGMPPLQHNIQSWAQTPGSYYQNTKILDRPITLTFNLKNKNLRITGNPDSSPLRKLRQQLIDIFKPDVNASNEPFLFSYQDGEREIFLNMRYEAGLEGSWDIRNGWTDSFPVRFLATDPMMFENNYHAQRLVFSDSAQCIGIAGRINGKWSNMNYGMNALVLDVEKTRTNGLYAGGDFSISNNNASAVDPLLATNYIAYWDGSKWSKVGTGANGFVLEMAIAPNGDIYATGMFTTIGGVAANYIAKWNGVAWSALGAGLDDIGNTIVISPDGTLYVGGAFHNAGGSPAYHIAKWDGISWHSMGAMAGLNNDAVVLVASRDGGTVYVGGDFTDQYSLAGNALLFVTKYDVSSNTFSAVGNGFDNVVLKLAISKSGILYATGQFVKSGTTVLNGIAKWNGSGWTAMGSGFGGAYAGYSIAVAPDETVYVGGDFKSIDGRSISSFAMWNGSDWLPMDIKYGGGSAAVVESIQIIDGNIYTGGGSFGGTPATKSLFSAINTVFNYGTAATFPLIYIYGPGKLVWIENQTTGKRICFDLSIFDDEEIYIDFGKKTVTSVVRGDLTYTVLPGSDFADFYLAPGNNTLAVFMTDDVASDMIIYYRPAHWSVDSTKRAEALP